MVVVRLLLPISIESPFSVQGQIDSWANATLGEPTLRIKIQPPSAPAQLIIPSIDSKRVSRADLNYAQSHPYVSKELRGEELLGMSILFGGFVITAIVLLRRIGSHLRFSLKLRSCRILDDQRLIDLLLRECDSLAVGRRPMVREVPSLDAPAVFGLFRHTICFPLCLAEDLSEQELRLVVRHELAHIRRYDIPVAIIASIAGAFHWFNPIVWLVVSRLRASMEAAADGLALKNASYSDTVVYGDLLLRFAERIAVRKQLPTIGLISIASGKDLKRRVELLVQARSPVGLSAKVLSAVMVITIAGLGLTDAREVSNQKMPDLHLVTSDSIDLDVTPMWHDFWFLRENEGQSFVATYQVASILQSMPESLSSSNKSAEDQLASWIPISSLKGRFQVAGTTLSADLSARQHQLLKQTLDIWKDGEPKQITIEARIVQTDIHTASSIDWARNRIDGLTVKGLGPAIAARIDEPKLAQLLRTVASHPGGSIMSAPKVTLFDGQTAGVADQVQRPFVTGVDPKSDGRMQPIVSVVDEGLTFVLTPRSSEDDSITLDFEVKASSIGKVSYANLPIRSANEAEPQFTVQVPATEQYEVSSSAKLAFGESIVVAIPRVFDNAPGANAETTVIVALTPRVIKQKPLVESE